MTWDWSDETRTKLSSFLADRGITKGPITTRTIGEGHSNLTFLVSDGHNSVIVRRPPPPPILPGAHDVLREARFLNALENTPVPVAKVLATSTAGEVLDVPFYVMTYIEGPVATVVTPEPLNNPADRRLIGESLVDTLAALHSVDWRAAGLTDLGRPEGFNARHVSRMAALIAEPDGSAPPEFADITAWLLTHAPAESGDAIIHLDYRLGNVILAPDSPGRVAAVLDWELAAIGDPLFDFAAFLTSYPSHQGPRTATEDLGKALLEPGYPSREEVIERYAELRKCDLSQLPWFEAMALWKLAVLYEYGRRRAIKGIGDPYYADPTHVRDFLKVAHLTAGISPPAKV